MFEDLKKLGKRIQEKAKKPSQTKTKIKSNLKIVLENAYAETRRKPILELKPGFPKGFVGLPYGREPPKPKVIVKHIHHHHYHKKRRRR